MQLCTLFTPKSMLLLAMVRHRELNRSYIPVTSTDASDGKALRPSGYQLQKYCESHFRWPMSLVEKEVFQFLSHPTTTMQQPFTDTKPFVRTTVGEFLWGYPSVLLSMKRQQEANCQVRFNSFIPSILYHTKKVTFMSIS